MKVTAPTALIAMQAATVLAAPFAAGNALVARQSDSTIYTNPNGDGVSSIEFADSKLNYGARVPSTILDIIRDECLETGCSPTGDYGFTSRVVNSDRASDVSYTITVEGTFASPGKRGDKGQLLELAKLAFEAAYNNGAATRRQGVIYITGECPAWQTNGCPGQDVSYTDQWESISHVIVRIANEDDSLDSYLNVAIDMDDGEVGSGICEALSAASSGLGLVNPTASAGFSLASIACGAI